MRIRSLRTLTPAFVALYLSSPATALAQSSGKGVSVPANSGRRPEPTQPARPTTSGSGQPAAVGVVPFADTKFRMDAIGLTMSLPEGATAQSTTIGGRGTTQIMPANGTWVLNIQTPRTNKADATIGEAVENTISLLQGSVGVVDPDQKAVLETEARILDRNDSLMLNGGAAARFYISLPNTDKSRLMKGYTIFKPSAQQYVVFEFITAEREFAKAKPVYEAIVATASFEDSEAVLAERGAMLQVGVAFLNGLTEADYVQAMPSGKVWQRMFKPAATGSPADAEEIGYRGIRFWRGQRGEVDPSRPRGSYSKMEQEDGYLCSLEGRVAVHGQWADTRQVCFMSPDRAREAWSIVMVVRDENGREVAVASETGARDGTNLTVVTKEPRKPVETVSPPVPEGYISQFENFLLPRLLVRKKLQTTAGFYAWSTNKSVSFRKDVVSRETAGKSGAWSITTFFRDQDAKQTYTYNDKGDLIRGEVDGMGSTEPMEPAQLMRLWEQKGLPTGKLGEK